MELVLIPRLLTPPDGTVSLARGMTHADDAPCPLAHANFPHSSLDPCCSLRPDAENLDQYASKISRRLYEDMDTAEALRFAGILRETADRIEQHYAGMDEKKGWPICRGRIDMRTRKFIPLPMPSVMVGSIRQTADWYENVARLGFGVHVWS